MNQNIVYVRTTVNQTPQLEQCPDCGAILPYHDGATHRYVGASPACWALLGNLVNAGEPELSYSPLNQLITDAYMVQHHGVPSPQAIQSVAVHLLVLYGVFDQKAAPAQALWIRQRALRTDIGTKQGRFHWLTPPVVAHQITFAEVVHMPNPIARTNKAQEYMSHVWQHWSAQHRTIVANWYSTYVDSGR
jgi:Family of unknown function (DUF5946)